nr:MAG TPA: hypothetical protein [Caudoviricetes sp.]
MRHGFLYSLGKTECTLTVEINLVQLGFLDFAKCLV